MAPVHHCFYGQQEAISKMKSVSSPECLLKGHFVMNLPPLCSVVNMFTWHSSIVAITGIWFHDPTTIFGYDPMNFDRINIYIIKRKKRNISLFDKVKFQSNLRSLRRQNFLFAIYAFASPFVFILCIFLGSYKIVYSQICFSSSTPLFFTTVFSVLICPWNKNSAREEGISYIRMSATHDWASI